jgi:hypothetical protein
VATGEVGGAWCGHPGRQSPRDEKRIGKTNISKEAIKRKHKIFYAKIIFKLISRFYEYSIHRFNHFNFRYFC